MDRAVKKKRRRWSRLFNYQSIVAQIPFFLFMALLAVAYIYNGHYADRLIRKIGKTSSELKDLQSEYKSVTGDVLLRGRQSEMVETVKPMGLKELTDEPMVLIDSTATN